MIAYTAYCSYIVENINTGSFKDKIVITDSGPLPNSVHFWYIVNKKWREIYIPVYSSYKAVTKKKRKTP